MDKRKTHKTSSAGSAFAVGTMPTADSDERFYTEGVIKELQVNAESNAGTICFSIEPASGYSMEFMNRGEKKTVVVLRPEKSTECIFSNGVADLYAGDFLFSIEGRHLDRLLSLKISGCHVRLYVKDKGIVDGKGAGRDGKRQHDNENKFISAREVVVSEIRVTQR